MSGTEGTFDPSKHLTKVSGNPYLAVKWRIVWARSLRPDISITSELVSHQGLVAIFKATVSWATDDGMVVCTDYGSESSDDFGDYIEKASTKAIGRALALAGYGTAFCPDFDFGEDRQRAVDGPVDIRGARGQGQQGQSQPSRPQAATPRQHTYLQAVARELGLTSDDLNERSMRSFGGDVDSLNRRDISSFIEQLQAERVVPGMAT